MSTAIVMKFGGTSVADADRLRGVAAIAVESSDSGVLLVLSAFSGVTDSLFAAGRAAVGGNEVEALSILDKMIERHREVASELLGISKSRLPKDVEAAIASARAELGAVLKGAFLLRALPEKSLDILTGRGELLSTVILAAFMGVPWIDARTVMRTDSRFGSAKPLTKEIGELAVERVLPLVGPGRIAVTQGYIGADVSGAPTTLGRGGSDYSASLFGAAIGASEIQIWTDVEGILTCDPRVVPAARPVELLGYDEAAELAAFGAKVLHPATILPAVELGIPVTVRNSMVPKGRFTTISRESSSGQPVTALASRGPVTVLTVRTPRMLGGAGFLASIFEAFGRREVSVDLVSTSEVSVSATVDGNADVDDLAADLGELGEVRIMRDRAVVALVGERLLKTPGIPGRALGALRDIPVEMISLGANEINLSLVVERSQAAEAQRRLHAAFFEN
ncbi:MAG: aspartate kinase [Rectinemataceae bacterium]